jgi:hypothetical protein
MTRSIPITKKDGTILNLDAALNRLAGMLSLLRNGQYVLTLTRQEKKRTLAENRLFWLWMACIEHETGTPKEDCHDYYCSLFLRRHVTVNGDEKEVTGGTSKLNTVQFTDFLNKIQADAATEFGIKLPDPDDLHFEAFRQEYERYINF